MGQKTKETFHEQLKLPMEEYVNRICGRTKDFFRAELFGLISQLRSSALSVILYDYAH